ncbi:methionine adenosyltransferase [Acetobacterium carbinolicum]|uniref:methionine adenosyltransferase n=1 Tax=Acetobacterium carbinolicum TaxID=52690 RepID=UPI0039C93105
MKNYFSSESVTEGHPDKMCDLISDAILDAMIERDSNARVACETTASPGLIHVMGEITVNGYVDIEKIVRNTVREIGYVSKTDGFDADTCAVLLSINSQSSDIAQGVNYSLESKNGFTSEKSDLGAGDQGMMFGYACDETAEFMPMAIVLAHKLSHQLAVVRKNNTINYLCPDGKSQVTIEYDDNKPIRVDTVLIAAQHHSGISQGRIKRDIINNVIKPKIPEYLLDERTKFLVNTTGRFVVGGPTGDTGLTGRKIIVDTYGGYARHGGGAFSGKDPTKVDRTASYAMRYLAKNIVASGAAKKCEIQVAYAIGVSKPVSICINTYGTGKWSEPELSEIIRENIDLRPTALIDRFNMKRPIYKQIAAYGHFGRNDLELPWEKLDSVHLFK